MSILEHVMTTTKEVIGQHPLSQENSETEFNNDSSEDNEDDDDSTSESKTDD